MVGLGLKEQLIDIDYSYWIIASSIMSNRANNRHKFIIYNLIRRERLWRNSKCVCFAPNFKK